MQRTTSFSSPSNGLALVRAGSFSKKTHPLDITKELINLAINDKSDLIEASINAGTDLNMLLADGLTFTRWVVVSQSINSLQILVNHKIDIDGLDIHHLSPLGHLLNDIVIDQKKKKIIEMLINNGADIERQNSEGKPLYSVLNENWPEAPLSYRISGLKENERIIKLIEEVSEELKDKAIAYQISLYSKSYLFQLNADINSLANVSDMIEIQKKFIRSADYYIELIEDSKNLNSNKKMTRLPFFTGDGSKLELLKLLRLLKQAIFQLADSCHASELMIFDNELQAHRQKITSVQSEPILTDLPQDTENEVVEETDHEVLEKHAKAKQNLNTEEPILPAEKENAVDETLDVEIEAETEEEHDKSMVQHVSTSNTSPKRSLRRVSRHRKK